MTDGRSTQFVLLVVAAWGALLGAAPLAHAQIFPAQQVRTGYTPKAVGIADMDEDGRFDIVEAGPGGGPLAICLHRDDGSFAPQTGDNLGAFVRRVVLADLNGDGHVDGAKPHYSGITIAIGNGAGGSAVGVVYSDFDEHIAIAAADLDADGDLDLVDVDKTTATLGVRLGSGAGTFAASVAFAGGAAPSAIALGDLDGDGAPDAVAAGSTGNVVVVRLGDGAGGLRAAAAFAAPGQPIDVALVDVDLDGALDALTADFGTGTVSWLRGDGTGGFAAPVAFAAGLSAKSIVVADLDLDGRPDVAAGCRIQPDAPGVPGTSAIAVLIGTAAGTFLPAAIAARGLGRTSLAAGDLTCDGYPDLAFDCEPFGGMTGIIVNDGSGHFVDHTAFPVTSALAFSLDQPDTLIGGDVDQDGDVDLVHRAANLGTELLANDGSGAFASPLALPASSVNVRLGDLDADGDLDLVWTAYGSPPQSGAFGALGDGTGGFAAPILLWQPTGSGIPRAISIGDLNADGAADLVVTSHHAGIGFTVVTKVAIGRSTAALQYTSTALVDIGLSTASSGPPGDGVDLVVVRDVDGDGAEDIVAAGWEPENVYLLRGNGAGGVSSAAMVLLHDEPSGLVVEDLNADGIVDLAVSSEGSHLVKVRRGLGQGSFAPEVQLVSGHDGRDLVAADFDQDGRRDLAHGSETEDGFTVLLGDGGFNFERRAFGVPPRPGALVVADFDGDGRSDVAVWSMGLPDRVTFARNRSGEQPWTCFGHGLAGLHGAPRLVSTGTLATGSAGTLRLENANPNKLAVLFVSNQSQPVSFYGTTLIPFPVLVAAPFTTNAQGVVDLAWSQWPLLAPGATHWFQYGVVDTAGPLGAAFSNALRAIQP